MTPKATKEPAETEKADTTTQLIQVLPQPTEQVATPTATPEELQQSNGNQMPDNTIETEEQNPTETTSSTVGESNATIGNDIEGSAQQKTVVMEMNENTTVYAETLEKIKEEGTEMVLAMSKEVTWTIDGSEITTDSLSDIDFAVTVGSSDIPEEKITELVTGEDNYVELSLAHEGEFGFDAVLTVDLENAVPGEYANLFYYNETTKEFEFLCAAPIGEDNKAAFNFKHASDYVIIISEKSLDDKVETILEEREQEAIRQKAEHKAMLEAKEAPTKEPVKATGIMILILLGSIAVAIGAILIINKKK